MPEAAAFTDVELVGQYRLTLPHGMNAVDASGQKWPAGQGVHASLPWSAWYEPAAQVTQVDWFVAGWTVPGEGGGQYGK